MQMFAGFLTACERLYLNFRELQGIFCKISTWLIAIYSEDTNQRGPEKRWQPQTLIKKTPLDLFPLELSTGSLSSSFFTKPLDALESGYKFKVM